MANNNSYAGVRTATLTSMSFTTPQPSSSTGAVTGTSATTDNVTGNTIVHVNFSFNTGCVNI